MGGGGGVEVAWREKSGFQVEEISNYGPNVVSFVLMTVRQRWYVVGSYMPPNYAPTVACIEQLLGHVVKGVEVIPMGDLNIRLQETRDMQEEELAMVVADCGLET